MTDEDAPTEVGTLGRAPTGRIEAAQPEPTLDERYEVGGLLGRGGMGEVRFAHDVRIDREVAVKLMRPEQRDEQTIARFFREARIQGQLDHPAVVPVHDLGIDRLGNPYFVMKRLAGTTLAEVLARRGDDAAIRDKWPRRQLLARFVDICLVVELAHTRGIVHRDLKPANIMLGDFGESYVLDWGLARVLGDARRSAPIIPLPGDSGQGGPNTVAGDVLGTPGYMPPEQIRGAAVDGRADVYALGCILYEILTEAHALPRGVEAIQATLEARCHRPSERHPDLDIPPELDDLCARATSWSRDARPSARALADAVQAYLDGDQDLARRRELAGNHAARAREALTEGGDAGRAHAMREAGRALALDPSNDSAQQVLARLLLEAPDALPAEARVEAETERAATRQMVLRRVWKGYAGMGLLTPLLYLFPIHHIAPLIALHVMLLGTAVVVWISSRTIHPAGSPIYLMTSWLNALTLLAGSLVFGPLLVVPMFVIGSLGAALAHPVGYRPPMVIIPHVGAVVVPLVLEWVGVLPPTYRIVDGGLLLAPWAIELTPTLTAAVMVLAFLSQAAISAALALAQRTAQTSAQDRLHAHSWHLRQLLPGASAEPEVTERVTKLPP